MDNRCYSRGLMASWYGHFIYCGRINSYPSFNCFSCNSGKLNFGEEGALTNECSIPVEANTIIDDSLSTMGFRVVRRRLKSFTGKWVSTKVPVPTELIVINTNYNRGDFNG